MRTKTYGLWHRWRVSCPRCWGAGTLTTEGEPYTREELRAQPDLWADILVNGGWAGPAVVTDCPRCKGTGRRR